jgi:hypothetical protein
MAVASALAILSVGTASAFAQVQITDCMACHNDTSLITAKQFAWEESVHGNGEATAEDGGRASCTGCHSGASFSAMVAAGQNPTQVTTVTAVTRQDCRACHQIHTTYKSTDWDLETTAPVKLFALGDAVYDGGKGNLCVNCHQPRSAVPAADAAGNIKVASTRYGPHHGPQSAMLLGIGGAGVAGEPSAHSLMVEDTCVTCHLGANQNHTFTPEVATCVTCHPEAKNFDIGGVQTDIQAKLDQVAGLLKAKGLLNDEGVPVVGTYPAAQASALWNYIFIGKEDKSRGVHNAAYAKALLEAAVAALQ